VVVRTRADTPSGRRGGERREFPRCNEHVPAGVRPDRDAISAAEASQIIGVQESTLHQWRRRDKGPSWVKQGGRYWYNQGQVEEFARAWRLVRGDA
jgi:hypothetical protein